MRRVLGAACFAGMCVGVGMALVGGTPRADAFPFILNEWKARYPDSTIPTRMTAALGAECFTCHHPPVGVEGTCYRSDISQVIADGKIIEVQEILEFIEPFDSDGDGVDNLTEITTARADLMGEVGYHPGLVGDMAIDNCSEPEGDPVATGAPETPPSADCPGDTNGDDQVDFTDLNNLLNDFGDMGEGLLGDLDGDGDVDFTDLNELLSAFGDFC